MPSVQARTKEHFRCRRRCQRCGAQRPLKDLRRRRPTLVFGASEVRAPRFDPCRCSVTSRRTITPPAEITADRCTSEDERAHAKTGALLPCHGVRSMFEGFFRSRNVTEVKTIRQRTMHVGAKLKREVVTLPMSAPSTESRSIAVAIDAGMQVLLSRVSAEADPQQQLRGVLYRLGATPWMPVTILSDGSGRPRSLGEVASVGSTHHVPEWIHFSARVQHITQPAKGWPDATPSDREGGTRLADSSSMSVGVSGSAKCGRLSISLETLW
jgi:hypothetical protein